MKKLKASSQYKKDYKRFRNNPKKVEKLFRILELLRAEHLSRRNISRIYWWATMPVIWSAILKGTFCLYGLTPIPTRLILSVLALIPSCLVKPFV